MLRPLIMLVLVSGVAAACSGDGAVSTTTSSSTTSSSTTTTSSTTTSTTTSTTSTTTTTTEAPQPTETTAPVPVEPQYVLLLDGFDAFGVLGDDADDVYEAFEEVFGEPTADSDWLPPETHGCDLLAPMRTVVWIDPGVRLTFVNGETDFGTDRHLAAYSTVLPVDPPWELSEGGLRREMTVDQIQEAFPDAEVIDAEPLDRVRLIPEVASYVSIDAGGGIREFWGGGEYCG